MEQQTNNAQEIINEAEGLSFEEKTKLYLGKIARGELKHD